jgi:glycosyltransferase involved in cell wall biosynthesis
VKIFVFSTVFAPNIGGQERSMELLCRELQCLGHQTKLATLTTDQTDRDFAFDVIRGPSFKDFIYHLNWCDIHLQAGVSLKYFFPFLFLRKKMCYRHGVLYKRDNSSIGILDCIKRNLARLVISIGNNPYVSRELRCEYTVLNLFDDQIFATERKFEERPYDVIFSGRLVSQKGCDTLIDAIAYLRKHGLRPNLTIVGHGPDYETLEARAKERQVRDQIRFTGPLTAQALAAEFNLHRVVAVPSRYEEAFGAVALEGLACGCFPVVSARGGLPYTIGGFGRTFANGDVEGLADALAWALRRPEEASRIVDEARDHVAAQRADRVAARYVEVFEEIRQRR